MRAIIALLCAAHALVAPTQRVARGPARCAGAATTADYELRSLMPAQAALLITKWKMEVENQIALGFLPQHTHPDRSVQRIMFVKKAFDRAYADMRTFAAASQAGPEAVAKLDGDLSCAKVVGSLRNDELHGACLALVLDRGGTRDVLHCVVTPDVREPAKILRSEAAFLGAIAAEAEGNVRLSALACGALLSEPADVGFRDGDGDLLEASAPAPAPAGAPPTAAEWRAACDASGVTSYADFGVALGAPAAPAPAAPAPAAAKWAWSGPVFA